MEPVAGEHIELQAVGIPPERVIRDLTQVLGAAKMVAGAADLNRLLEEFVRRASRIVDVERASLFLVDEQAGVLWTRVSQESEEIRVPLGQGIVGHAAETRSSIVVQDAYADPRFHRQVDVDTGFRTRNILAVPLVEVTGRVVGVLQLLNKRAGAFLDYDRELLEAFGGLTAVVLDKARLVEEQLRRERLEASMNVAREIQSRFLPCSAPEHPGLELAGRSVAAEAAGGDYYDFHAGPGGEMVIAVGDVTGHGVGPALLMASVRATLRAMLADTADPGLLLERVNRQLVEDTTGGRFVTLVVGSISADARELRYATAGHRPPLLLRGPAEVALEPGGIPAGLAPGIRYSTFGPVALEPGDVVFCGTDGLWESRSPEGELLGLPALREVLGSGPDRTAQGLLEAVFAAEEAHRDVEAPSDDRTGLVAVIR